MDQSTESYEASNKQNGKNGGFASRYFHGSTVRRTLPPRTLKRSSSCRTVLGSATGTGEPNLDESQAKAYTERLPFRPVSLASLAAQYSEQLPQQIRVVRGSVCTSKKGSTTNDIFDIHFVQSRETVDIGVSPQRLFKVPSNSAIKFSILYSGGERVFSGLRDVIAADPVPKIICTQNVYLVAGEGPRFDIFAGEILAPGELVVVGGYECLAVHSFATSGKKYLTMDNTSSFTTEESRVALYLSDLLPHVKDLFPSQVKLLNEESRTSLGEVYTLYSKGVTTTLIGTLHQCEQVLEIPADADVEVTFVPQTRDSMKALQGRTRSVLERIGNGKIQYTPLRETDPHVCRMQDHLYDAVLVPSRPVPAVRKIPFYPYDYVQHKSAKLEGTEDSNSRGSMERPYPPDRESDVFAVISRELRGVKEAIEELSNDLKPLKRYISPSDTTFECSADETRKSNRHQLQGLSRTQVIELLGKMGLSQHEERFVSKSIDGLILSELDEATLEQELGIGSKIDRVKVMLIISGKLSVLTYFQSSHA